MNENKFDASSLNTVKRLPKRGHYDKETIFNILDRHFLCHLAWEVDGQPYLIPTAYGRKEETLYVHGSSKSRMLSALTDGRPLSLVVTQFDGLVLARSAFHHSINYQSVVLFGHARELEGDEKYEALKIVSDQIIKGRWDEVRLPTPIEMKATMALAITIDTASAKIRTGPPVDDDEDYNLPLWAGILPARLIYESPIPDPKLQMEMAVPESVKQQMKTKE
jgi:nitroimidazol reductase NimA-like FMN-containing flavoprotein (pyridoxamine 5'-phosphate oxidase superfamily)